MLVYKAGVFIFWLCFITVFYANIFYPFMIYVLSLFLNRPHKIAKFFPQLSLIIPFYNAERFLKDKVENIKELRYPQDRLEIIFIDDGSTDKGVDILKQSTKDIGYKVTVLELPEHKGKSYAINEGARISSGEILIFSDVSGILNREAIEHMVQSFYGPQVGAVLGIYRIVSQDSYLDKAESHYWDFELFLKRRESFIWTTLGGHGALYAVRKSLFEPLSQEIINDDFIIPARISMKGFRTVYEEKALLYDRVSTSFQEELRRRIRINYGNWQQIFFLKELFTPKHKFLLWQFVSHKILRCPQGFFIGIMFLTSIFLEGLVYKLLFWMGGVFIICSLIGLVLPRFKLFNMCTFLCLGVISNIIGSLKFLLRRRVSW